MTINVFGGGNTGGPAFPVQRSVRLRSSASAYFSRTPASATNRKTWTWSGWVKRGALGVNLSIMGAQAAATAGTQRFNMYFAASTDTLVFSDDVINTSTSLQFITTQVFRDPSAWYHIVLAIDTTQATSTNRVKLYINGTQVTSFSTATYPSLNFDTAINNNVAQYLGYYNNLGTTIFYYDGYLTEVNLIDGQQLTPSSFGSINSTTGVWQPIKYNSTYGANGFYLNFQDNSAATAAAIGKDSSGNGNNWTPNNISVTAGVTYDSMLDVPTLTSSTNANFAVMNPLDLFIGAGGTPSISNGNLRITSSATANSQNASYSSIAVTSGQWYFETTVTTLGAASTNTSIGMFGAVHTGTAISSNHVYLAGYVSPVASQIIKNGSAVQTGLASITSGDVIGVAYDATNTTCQFYRNGSTFGSQVTGITADTYQALIYGLTSSGGVQWVLDANFGQRPFTHPVPSGFVALNTYNLPAPTIPNGAANFAATLWTGTGVERNIDNSVNGKSFQPDLVWLKRRSSADSNGLFDAVRGASKRLQSNDTGAEATTTAVQSAFLSNGFTVGTDVQSNGSGSTYVGWQWKASNAAPVTNTSGSITSSVSANPSAGFSIVTYTGTGANATVGHGLGVAPKMMILKSRSNIRDWPVYHTSIGAGNYLALNTTAASAALSTMWNSTAPTSTVFSVGSALTSNDTSMVAYCFSEIAGYSKFGSYTGNGSTDGPFVYLGFRPRFVLTKQVGAISDWAIHDSSRATYNLTINNLYPNSSSAEYTGTNESFDFLSNGFKPRAAGTSTNASGGTYIYAAFAESPFNYSLAR